MFYGKTLGCLTLFFLPLTLQADTISDLVKSQSNTILYQSQANEYEALNKLSKLNGTIKPKKEEKVSGQQPDQFMNMNMNNLPKEAAPLKEPVVMSILGVNGLLFADFLLQDGTRVEGKVGTTLPGDYKVVSISDQQVVLRKDSKTFTASHQK